jgi:PAS domain S-box-containing protein
MTELDERFRRLVALEREAAALRSELEVADTAARAEPFPADDPRVWQLLAHFGSDFLSVHAPDGTYLYASPSCEKLLGWAPEDFLGKSAYDFLHPVDLEEVARNHESHADAEAEPVKPVAYRLRCKDGSYRWMETRSRVLTSPEGRTTIVAITQDISERHAAEEAQEQLVTELQERLSQIEALEELIPVCAWCQNVRDDEGYWKSVTEYLETRQGLKLTHGICPECEAKARAEAQEQRRLREAREEAGDSDERATG